MVKITTFNDRPVRHVRYSPDGTVILKLYERRPNRRARHLRVSLARWLAGRGIYLLESHATQRVSRNAPHPLRWRFSRVSSRPRPSRPFPTCVGRVRPPKIDPPALVGSMHLAWTASSGVAGIPPRGRPATGGGLRRRSSAAWAAGLIRAALDDVQIPRDHDPLLIALVGPHPVREE